MAEPVATISCFSVAPISWVLPSSVPECVESTALGAAYLAGLSTGFWRNTEEIASLRGIERTFMSNVSAGTRSRMLDYWHECVDGTHSR